MFIMSRLPLATMSCMGRRVKVMSLASKEFRLLVRTDHSDRTTNRTLAVTIPSPSLLNTSDISKRLLLVPPPLNTPPVRPLTLAASLVSSLPSPLQPYLRLARLDKPIGSWLLFWPCGWSLCLATPAGQLPDLKLLAVFGVGAFVMRGAGCTINDMWDRDIDKAVERTRDRPITSGQVTLFDALVFLGGQLGLGLLILLELNWYSVLLGAASMGLVVTYPVMKRFTYYPQFVLGLAFNWGALLGWSALSGTCNWSVVLPLYAAGISWTMIYDTIYAHQDKYDDVIIGMKSTAIKFGDQTPVCLSCFATTMVLCLLYCGWTTGQTFPFYLSLLGVGGHLAHQIVTLDINNRDDCASKFVSNRWVGLGVFLGILAGTLVKEKEQEQVTEKVNLQDVVEGVARAVNMEEPS
eukprot:GFUD01070540.1.p1 GENE.GFUD01070540.1~~GFUD01070540.1.p1  ORF type:complete len:408 (+),score=104.08 GFUD01070540.1:56-1279(+)